MVKLAKAAKKQAPQKKKAPPPPKEVEEESSEEDEEEEAPPTKAVAKKAVAKKAATPAKKVKNGKAAAKQESDDEESEEEAPPPKKATPAKAAAPAKKAAPAEESDDEEDDEDDESEEELPPPKKATPAKATKKAAPAAKAPAAAEEDEEDDDDDEEEEMDTTPAPKKAGMVKAKEDSEEEEDDDDDDEEDDDEEEEETPVTPAKRKAEAKKEKGTPPPKKAKTDGEGFSLYLGNLNNNKDFDEIKSAITKFFSKEGLEIQEVRLGGTKKFGYVDFTSEEDLQKALGLNGKNLLGQPVKLDKAKSKENSQENKKERDSRTLFVKNLPYSVTQEELKEIFDQAVDIRIPMGNSGSSRGIAYLEFKSEAIAEKAMEEAQGTDVQGRSIIIDFTGEKSQKGGKPAGVANKVLVVNNLAFTANEDSLQSVFEKAVSIRIPQNNGRPKG